MAGDGKGSGAPKVGRPNKFGEAQIAHVDSRQQAYNKKRDNKATQNEMTTFLDDETVKFFSIFGWEDPERCVPLSVAEPTPDVVDRYRAEAAEAKSKAKGADASEVHKKQDDLVQHVRSIMAARFKNNYKGPAKASATGRGPAADINKLLLSYLEKPSLQHLYQVWAKSCPDLDAEVDRRLPEVRLRKGDPEYKRIGVWNTVAAERYAATSDEEKEETLQKAKLILGARTDEWKERLSEPKSMEEATSFMLASQSFLEDLMQFFADRCGGMAVMILAGSGKVMVSEGTCDIPGRPKILYSDVEGERPLLQGFAGRIHTQACLVSESRWGVRLSDDNRASSHREQDTSDSLSEQLADQACSTSTRVSFGEDTSLARPMQAEGRDISDGYTDEMVSTTSSASIIHVSPTSHVLDSDIGLMTVKDQAQDGAHIQSNDLDSISVSRLIAPRLNDKGIVEGTARGVTMVAQTDETSRHAPKPRPKPRKRSPQSKTSDTMTPAPTSIETCGDSASNLGTNAFTRCETTRSDSSEDAQGADELDGDKRLISVRHSQCEIENLMPALSIANEGMPSIFAFRHSGGNTLYCDEVAYQKDCSTYGAVAEERKKWFILYGMTNFMLAVPTKLMGRVNVGLACEVVRAYFKLELSNATECALDLERYKIADQTLPAYTAALQSKPKATRAVWHKRVKPGVTRTPALLDLDVGASLARQWAQQQPDARRSGEGVLERTADAHMDWEGRLAPDENALKEKDEWNALAQDFLDVLNILAAQAGEYKAPEASISQAQGEAKKRVKRATEKAALMQEESTTKRSGKRPC